MTGQTTTAGPVKTRSQRLVLITGVLLAAIAAVLVFVIARSAGDEGGGGGGGTDNVAAVVAQEDIAKGTLITADALEVTFVGPDEAVPEVFTSRRSVVDRLATEDIAVGEQVSAASVSDKATDSLAFKVSPGMRALSIEVKEVVTAGGNVKPGDRVDILGIFEADENTDLESLVSLLAPGQTVVIPEFAKAAQSDPESDSVMFVVTATLLQDVKVLAVAQELAATASNNDEVVIDENVDAEPRAATATLELTPDQSQLMTLADEYGILRLSARSVGDESTAPVAPIIATLEKTR
jgi:pilus assembly protein CpaB